MNSLIGKQFAQYQMGPLLGEGGMGAVYQARNLKTDQVVALKIMLPNLAGKPAFRRRFQWEAQAVTGFNCPAIVKIYDYGVVDDLPYMAMEYIPGGSLDAYLKQLEWAGEQMPLEQVLALGAQIAEGLAYAHQRGLIHRDVKPGNVLLKLRDETAGPPRQAVLSDFGLAIRLTEDDQATNPFMGSLAYMSPEQCENKPLDGRADIYAAGILLYQLAAGQLPYRIEAPADIVKHLEETPLPPRLINPALPPVVEEIILKAIAKRPGERYQTAAEMAHALRQAAATADLPAASAETDDAVTQWLDNRWNAELDAAGRLDPHKTWTTPGRCRLFVVSQHENPRIYSLDKAEITIGRSPDNDVILEDRTISARHLRLRQTAAGWQVRDLGSTNGAWLGGRALAFEQDVPWPEHEFLQIGPYQLKWQPFDHHAAALPPPANGAAGRNGAAAVAAAAAVTASAAVAARSPAPAPQAAAPPLPQDAPLPAAGDEDEILTLAVTPEAAVIEPGVDQPLELTIVNRGITVKEISLRLLDENGQPVLWAYLEQNSVKLLPDESAVVSGLVNLPPGVNLPAGDHALQIQAVTDKGERQTARLRLTRAAEEAFTLDMHPLSLQEGVVCRLTVRDNSNFANEYTLAGLDDADKLLFDFQEPHNAVLVDFGESEQRIRLNPGEEASVGFTIRPRKRPWFGSDKSYPFKMRVRTAQTDWQTLHGQVDIRPRVSRRMIILLLLLLLLLALFGFVFFNVVSARQAEQQRQILARVEEIGGTATAVYAAAGAAEQKALDAQATADALASAGESAAAQSAQATANALKAEAAQAQTEADALENQLGLLQSQLSATATPPPPPTDITLDGQNVPEDAPVGATVGRFAAVMPGAARPAGKRGGAYARPARQPQATFSLVSGDGAADNDAFYIDGNALKTAVLLDYETKTSYTIRVQADNGFGGVLQKVFAISVTDVDDTPVITISDVTVDENDGQAVIQVTMSGSTQSEVTVAYETKDGTAVAGQDYAKTDGRLTWKPGENGRREINVSLQDDAVWENEETFTLILSQPVIAEIGRAEATVTIKNDDPVPALSVADTAVGEGDGQAVFAVTLQGQSSQEISVSYATADGTAVAGQDYTAATGSLTWAAGETGAKEIRVPITDDDVDEPEEKFTLTLSGAANAQIDDGTAVAVLTDNDGPPRISLQPAGPFAESAGNAVITVMLAGSSSSDVTVTYATEDNTAKAGEDYTAVSGTLTWKAGDSSTARQITVPILADAYYESSDEAFVIRLSNPVNGVIETETAAYTITDDDTLPALSINDVTVDEAAGEVTVVVQLTGGGREPITVDYATTDGTAVAGQDYVQTASPPSLTWPAGEQNTQRTFTIPIYDDNIDEGASETFQVNLLNNSSNVSLAVNAATVTITDNDTRGVIVTPPQGNVAEPNQSDSFTISLASEPTADVVIPLSITPQPAQCQAPATVTLAPGDWRNGVSVTITPVDDAVVDGDQPCQIALDAIQSGDGQYNGYDPPDSVNVTVGDDDVAGIIISSTGNITATEGGANGRYTISLNSQPTADVIISFAVGRQIQATNNITFTQQNWNNGQTITVAAVDDPDVEGVHTGVITHTAASADPLYDANSGSFAGFSPAAVVNVPIVDNDTAGLAIAPTTGITVSEAGITGTYTVALTSRPASAVTVTLSADSQVTIPVTSLVFDAVSWNAPQTITVTAVDDFVDELSPHTGVITHTAASADSNYQGLPPELVTASVTDNDTAGITITETGGSTAVVEGGVGDTYTVVLDSRPTDVVTITVTPDSQVTASLAELVFTPSNWNTPQTVTVTAVNDLVDESSPHAGEVTHTAASADSNYQGLLRSLAVSVTDNDTAGITLMETGGGTAVAEGGAGDTYTVVLDSQPVNTVTVTLNTDTQVTASAASLVFTPDNWNIARLVTVTAVDDFVDEPSPHTGVITHTAASADANYQGLTRSLAASVTDNDTAGITITETGGGTAVVEGGASDTYTVVLDSQPASDVVVTLGAGAQVTTSVTSLTFTPANWNAAQTVTVTAVDDFVDESLFHTGVITHTAASADPLYDANSNSFAGFSPAAALNVSIVDNDTAGVTRVETNGSTDVTEDGATDTYTLVLDSQPTANVTISFNVGQQIVPISAVTFTPQNWNISQTITVAAVNDTIVEGPHTGVITHTVTSADPNYNNIFVLDVNVSITDND